MASFSKVMIIGNLGRDPDMRYTPNGRPVTEFSVAVNRSTKNQQTGEWVEATDWFRVTVWGDRAERTAEQLRKGTRVFVEGRFRTRELEGRDGQKRISLEITADSVDQPRGPGRQRRGRGLVRGPVRRVRRRRRRPSHPGTGRRRPRRPPVLTILAWAGAAVRGRSTASMQET